MEAESGGANIHLEPFIHQVGGHSSLLQLDKNTICKPLIPQELNFYKTSPVHLKKFMPNFKGIIEVTFTIDEDGFLNLTTYLPSKFLKSSGGNSATSHSLQDKNDTKIKHRISMLHRIRLCHAGNIQIESRSDDSAEIFEENMEHSPRNLLNPWVLHCHEKQMKKIQILSESSLSGSVFSQKYVLLENLTSNYEFPCILDVKMGTRSYADDASSAKRQRHMTKAALSTSAVLGVRLGGLQVYHHDSGHYICHSKQYGHGLTVEGFHHAFYHFLHNGTELQLDIVSQLLKKLYALQEVVRSLDTFRFFTGSLLIIYEGKRAETHQRSNFQNVDHGSGKSIQQLKKHSKNSACKNVDDAKNRKAVDVRMIDFSHSTHSQMPESCFEHSGPDEGYLLGLTNLIAMLKSFQQENDQPSLF